MNPFESLASLFSPHISHSLSTIGRNRSSAGSQTCCIADFQIGTASKHLARPQVESLSEIRYDPPDPAANPYLCYTALLMAGLDGVLNKIDPGEPMDKNLYELPPEEHAKIPQMPGSLREALGYLEADHGFLLKGDVFTADFLELWITRRGRTGHAAYFDPQRRNVMKSGARVNQPHGRRQEGWPGV